ncbi:MAG: hypothetical protein LDL41_12770 [Coleofasciculus sp. S288]|nr:hypothetical protein [Coleofasciculus sp. S288]
MEDLNSTNTNLEIGTIAKRLLKPGLIVQALAFTVILYFSVGHTPPNTKGALYQSVQSSSTLSASVGNSVLQHASHELGLPTSALRIVHIQAQTWSDKCLGLREAGVTCVPMSVPGWQIAVANGQQRWIYRTDASGALIKREGNISSLHQERDEVASQSGLKLN